MKQNRRVQYLSAFAVSLAIMTNSASYFWMSPILPKFHNNEIIADITSSEISWIVSMLAPGMVIGSLLASGLSDNFGRRATLLYSAFAFIIGTVLILCATKAWVLYIARVLWGCGSGMITTVSSMYLSEIADKDIRGTLTAGTRFMFSVGTLLILTVGSFVNYQVLTSLLIVFPVSYLIACWWIPESPYYLLKEGKIDAAKKELLKLSGLKDEKMIEEKLCSMRSDVRKEMAREGSTKELFTGKQYRKAIIIATGLRITQLMTGTIPVQQYLGRLVQQSNCGMEASTALIIFGAVRFVVGLTSPLIVDKVGRRPLLIYTYSTASVVLITVGAYFFVQQMFGVDNQSTNPFGYIVFIGIVLSNTIANIGFDTLIFIIPSEIFPLNVKSIAMTYQNVFTAFLTFIAIRGYQVMEDYTGLYGVFWFYGTMAFSGAIFTYFIVPETKGKSLREIQIELQGNIYDESDEKLNETVVVNDDIESKVELKALSKTSRKEEE